MKKNRKAFYNDVALRDRLTGGRAGARLSLAEVARRTGIDATTIRRIEDGAIYEPKFTDVAILADMYGIDLLDLTLETGLPYRRDEAAGDWAQIDDARIRAIVDWLRANPEMMNGFYHMAINQVAAQVMTDEEAEHYAELYQR